MTAIGGSVESISFAGREFAVASDGDGQIKLGGYENEIGMNGNKTGRILKTTVAHSIAGLTYSIDTSNGDHEFLQERANGKGFEDFTITYASGSIYQGQSQIVGEFTYSTASATAAVNFGGPDELTLQ